MHASLYLMRMPRARELDERLKKVTCMYGALDCTLSACCAHKSWKSAKQSHLHVWHGIVSIPRKFHEDQLRISVQ